MAEKKLTEENKKLSIKRTLRRGGRIKRVI